MQFVTPLLSLCGMLVPCGVKTITFASFKHIQFLSLTSQYCAHQIWHLHFSQHCNCRQHEQIYFLNLAPPKDLLLSMWLKPNNVIIATNTLLINSSFQQWRYLDVYTNKQMCFLQLCQCHLEFERTRRPSSFCFGFFFLAKTFNHIVKVANILHLKSGDNYRPNYFPTSTPSKHIACLHDQLIASSQFLIWKNTTDLLQVVDF